VPYRTLSLKWNSGGLHSIAAPASIELCCVGLKGELEVTGR
jgi:hypothetical protein